MADPENPKRPRRRRVKVSAGTEATPSTPKTQPATDARDAEIARLEAEVASLRQIVDAIRPRPETHTEYRERKRATRMTTAGH